MKLSAILLSRFVCVVLLALGCAWPAWPSVIVSRELASAALGREWSYAVYLPSGYETSRLRYPVLYLLHGSGGNFRDWVEKGRIQSTVDSLIGQGGMPAAIVVMPDAGSSWFVDRSERMESALLMDLIPAVERDFRTLATRDGRLLAGHSMGGYGALRFALKYPERFAAAALLSPAIYEPEPPLSSAVRRAGVFGAAEFDRDLWRSFNYPTLWQAFLARGIQVPLYINSGDDDEHFIEAEAVKLYSLLRRNGQPAELRIVDGGHVWPVWESTMGDALRYIFRFARAPVIDAPAAPSR